MRNPEDVCIDGGFGGDDPHWCLNWDGHCPCQKYNRAKAAQERRQKLALPLDIITVVVAAVAFLTNWMIPVRALGGPFWLAFVADLAMTALALFLLYRASGRLVNRFRLRGEAS